MKISNNSIFVLIVVLSMNYLYGQNTHKIYRSDDFYTDRAAKIDTLYLPVDSACLLHILVFRYVKDYQKVDTSMNLANMHHVKSDIKELAEDTIDAENCCWIPEYYKIFPMMTFVFFQNRNRISANDADDYIFSNNIEEFVDMQYWKAEKETKTGTVIAQHFPLVEMFLWEKITNEQTLVCDKYTLLNESLTIQIMPQK